MSTWPSQNRALLMGKVTEVIRIQWEDGETSALIKLCTRKRIIGKDGSWVMGYDFHQAEVSPGEKVFREVWPGAIVEVTGELDTFPWRPAGARMDVNVTVLMARGYQLVIPSPKERVLPRTVLRTRKTKAERASAGHTENL